MFRETLRVQEEKLPLLFNNVLVKYNIAFDIQPYAVIVALYGVMINNEKNKTGIISKIFYYEKYQIG